MADKKKESKVEVHYKHKGKDDKVSVKPIDDADLTAWRI